MLPCTSGKGLKVTSNIRDPFANFYVMPKIHKAGPPGSNTRPVSSSCGCLNHPISEWLNEALLPLAATQKLYVKNSFEFKRDLAKAELGPNCSIFTYDAVNLYPSIPTDECIQCITSWLSKQKNISKEKLTAINEALVIVHKKQQNHLWKSFCNPRQRHCHRHWACSSHCKPLPWNF